MPYVCIPTSVRLWLYVPYYKVNFPYSCRVYQPVKPLEQEYRIMSVKNYAVSYTVDEQNKLVEITRVFYAKRDLSNQL